MSRILSLSVLFNVSSRPPSRSTHKKALPLWIRSAIVVALIVLTCYLQRLSERGASEAGDGSPADVQSSDGKSSNSESESQLAWPYPGFF